MTMVGCVVLNAALPKLPLPVLPLTPKLMPEAPVDPVMVDVAPLFGTGVPPDAAVNTLLKSPSCVPPTDRDGIVPDAVPLTPRPLTVVVVELVCTPPREPITVLAITELRRLALAEPPMMSMPAGTVPRRSG